MNCPGGVLVYKTEPHSYKDLPIRMGELGIVHRHEKSGALHGLVPRALLHAGRRAYFHDACADYKTKSKALCG